MKKVLIVVFLLTISSSLFAKQAMDFMLFNLGNPATNPDAQSNFRKMSTQFTNAMAPMFFGKAETGGARGFEIGLGYVFTKISIDKDYWKYALNDEPRDSGIPGFYNALDMHFRKGFPFGLKLLANVRYFVPTEMISSGVGVEYALNEGLIKVPDISFGFDYNRLFGSTDLNMETFSWRVKVSKTLVAAREVKITPYLAYSHILSFASSNRLGGFYDYSTQQKTGSVWDPAGDAFYFAEEKINIDRLVLGFSFAVSDFSMLIEGVLPFNTDKSFNLNAGFSFAM